MPVRIDLLAFLLDIVTDGSWRDHYRNRVARTHLGRAGHQTDDRERPLGCESETRRDARA